jgi:hypothetical protein
VPDARRHRGAHPQDAELFGPRALDSLRSATSDLSWLLSRGYATPSATALVGDRYGLRKRQRIAVARCAASDDAVRGRGAREQAADAISGRPLWIDGYNALTTVEAALAGGVVLEARDGCHRDVASVHGSWRRVEETAPAIEAIGEELVRSGAGPCRWLLDSPVSNSGRLKRILLHLSAQRGWGWEVELVRNPDALLSTTESVVATSDSVVLDRCRAWTNLARRTVEAAAPGAWIVDLSV